VKPVFEKTPQRQWESFHCEVVRGRSYNAAWHFHPEYQLTLVLRSSGYRLVGDNITPLLPGDLVFVGANLPHVWHQAAADGGNSKPETRNPKQGNNAVHAIVVRFLDTFLGADFLEVPEVVPVKRLLLRASRGLHVRGRTREVVAADMERLVRCRGLERVAVLLRILDRLASSTELKPIASRGFSPVISSGDQDRMERVCAYIHAHLDEDIHRAVVAEQACLSEGAFSRFFRLRTGKTLPQYVNELRVGRACRLLADESRKVTDIAMECGFRNLANFNRHFRRIAGMAPREYRQQLRETAGEM
jgi:AraC-like DNA-binding protein